MRAMFIGGRHPDFVFFTDEKVFLVANSPDNQQNKVSGRLRELLKKRLSVLANVN